MSNGLPGLTNSAKLAIEQHIRNILSGWFKLIGISNLGALAIVFLYVAFVVPDQAAERLVPVHNSRVANLTSELEKRIGEAFVLAGQMKEMTSAAARQNQDLSRDISLAQTQLATLAGTDLSTVSQFVEAVGNSADLNDLVARIGRLEGVINSLGAIREGTVFTINNPVMSGADSATCPEGTFVSAIHASGAVGGRYAVDGITEIKFTCSRIH